MQSLTYVIGKDKRNLVDDIQNFKIDFKDSNYNWVQARQYEDGMRQVFVTIKNEDSTPFDLTGCNYWFEGILPDGVHKILDAKHGVAIDPVNGQFRFDMPKQAFAIAGSYVQAFFRIVRDGNSVTTLEFDLEVLADKVISGLVPRDYITPFEDLYDQLQQIISNADGDLDTWKQKLTDLFTTLKAQGADTANLLTTLQVQIKQSNLFTKGQMDELLGSLTSFKPMGSNLIDKLNNEFNDRSVNVKWFGALLDGKTDDTAALKAAIASLNDGTNYESGGTVFIPRGILKFTETIYIPQNVRIVGIGQNRYFYDTLSSSMASVLLYSNTDSNTCAISFLGKKERDNTNSSELAILGSDLDNKIYYQTMNSSLEYLTLISENQHALGIDFAGAPSSELYHVTVTGFLVGIIVSACWNSQISKCFIRSHFCGIFSINNVNDVLFDSCYIDMLDEIIPSKDSIVYGIATNSNLGYKLIQTGIANIFGFNSNISHTVIEHSKIGIQIGGGGSFISANSIWLEGNTSNQVVTYGGTFVGDNIYIATSSAEAAFKTNGNHLILKNVLGNYTKLLDDFYKFQGVYSFENVYDGSSMIKKYASNSLPETIYLADSTEAELGLNKYPFDDLNILNANSNMMHRILIGSDFKNGNFKINIENKTLLFTPTGDSATLSCADGLELVRWIKFKNCNVTFENITFNCFLSDKATSTDASYRGFLKFIGKNKITFVNCTFITKANFGIFQQGFNGESTDTELIFDGCSITGDGALGINSLNKDGTVKAELVITNTKKARTVTEFPDDFIISKVGDFKSAS